MGSQSLSYLMPGVADKRSDTEKLTNKLVSLTNELQDEKFIAKFFDCSDKEACELLSAAKLLADKAANLNGLRYYHQYLNSCQTG